MDISCLLSEEPKKQSKATALDDQKHPQNPVKLLVDNLWAATVPPTSTAGKLRDSTSQNVLESLNIADFPFPRSLIADMCQRVLKSIENRVNELAIQAEDGCKVIVQPIPIDWEAVSTELSCDKDECQTVWMELTRVLPKKMVSTSRKAAKQTAGQKRPVPPPHEDDIQPEPKRFKPLNIDTSALRAVLTPNRARVGQAPSLRDQLKVSKRVSGQSSLRSKLAEASATRSIAPSIEAPTTFQPESNVNTPVRKQKQANGPSQRVSCSEIQHMLLTSICAREQENRNETVAGAQQRNSPAASWQQAVAAPTKLDSPEDLSALTSVLWVDDGGHLRQPDWLTPDDATLVLAVRSYGLDWGRLMEHVGNVSESELRMRWELLILRCRDRRRAEREKQQVLPWQQPQAQNISPVPHQSTLESLTSRQPPTLHHENSFAPLPSLFPSFSSRQD